jgi:hypothetical protein
MRNDIEARFRPKGTICRGILLLPAVVALEFIDECKKENISLLGFDGFRIIDGEQIQPYLEHSLDLSSITFQHLSKNSKLNLAQQFIAQRQTVEDLVFEMVLV